MTKTIVARRMPAILFLLATAQAALAQTFTGDSKALESAGPNDLAKRPIQLKVEAVTIHPPQPSPGGYSHTHQLALSLTARDGKKVTQVEVLPRQPERAPGVSDSKAKRDGAPPAYGEGSTEGTGSAGAAKGK